MRDFLYEKIMNYKQINLSNDTKLEDLETLGTGIYTIDKIPPVNLIKEFPKIYNSSGEVSLLCIENVWFLTVSNKKEAYVPIELDNYIRKGSVQFFAHSHPDEKNGEQFPSFGDLQSCDSIDRKIYIISYLGIMEVDISNVENFEHLEERWESYLIDNKISFEEYKMAPERVYTGFLQWLGCNIKMISFNQEKEIDNMLKSKMMLEHEFWQITKEVTPYPGRK